MRANAYDVAIVGAGPAGTAAALAFARRGKSVLLLESDPRASDRLAGEWLHPSALSTLDSLGVDLSPAVPYSTGRGFVVFPDDGSEPIVLPYAAGRFGMAVDHALLVETMRAFCERSEHIDYIPWARALRIEGQALTFERYDSSRRAIGAPSVVTAPLLVGASGRASSLYESSRSSRRASSRVAGISLTDSELPFEGYLHIFLGDAGPVVAYRLDARTIRVLFDVPLSMVIPRGGAHQLYDVYSSVLPRPMRHALREACIAGLAISWSSIELRPRSDLGREGLALIGDAVGSHHPLTANGLTLAFEDAIALADSKSWRAFAQKRVRESRVPEMISVGLYEVFADHAEETVAMRRAIYGLWRANAKERLRTMGFWSGDDRNHLRLGASFLNTLVRGSADLAADAISTGQWRHKTDVVRDLGTRLGWWLGGTLHLSETLPARIQERIGGHRTAEARYGAALRAAATQGEVVGLPHTAGSRGSATENEPAFHDALLRATRALIEEQAQDGSFEGETVWNAMLPAQYVLAMHAMKRPISAQRRRLILKQFEVERLPNGLWGMHPRSEPYLFVTTLVYVAARLLGLAKEDPLLERAYRFIRNEGGAVPIPTWGKLWLAIVGLYEWKGVSPILPELWAMPRALPLHPSNYYCHTRLIYMGMATLYAEKWHSAICPKILAIRDEIYPGGYERVSWSNAREALRREELETPWSVPLTWTYRALARLEGLWSTSRRKKILGELRGHMRFDMQSTNHTCLSPVSGLLHQISLFIENPEDPDLNKALERFEGWIWEDETKGMRIAGARSSTWDSSFAAVALTRAEEHVGEVAAQALSRCDSFLLTQQMIDSTGREEDFYRIDPRGGYCFAGVWHGWPVSDCTAEALMAQLDNAKSAASLPQKEAAVSFILRCRNRDGGFGSYEPRRVDVSLESINPAEMFGDSMTEKSYIECTSSCIIALAKFAEHHPTSRLAERCREAVDQGVAYLRKVQRADGSWPAMWGVYFIYGTMFGVRGLLAGGVPPHDPQIRSACAFLKQRQRTDGGWSEHYSSVSVDRYVEDSEGQYVQTSWALMALAEAGEPDYSVLERAAKFLVVHQLPDGTWPEQNMEGVFFRTALLDYVLYRRYFPLWALGLFASRRAQRFHCHSSSEVQTNAS